MTEYNTACPRNCYSTCSFKVGVENGKVASIEPQPLNKATPEGICLKGLSYLERANSEQRILHPQLKKNGRFERIPWIEAIDLIAKKLNHYKEAFGSHSILYYAASGMSGLLNEVSTNFWRMIGGATTVFGNLCWPAGLEASRLTLGENKHNVPWDVENAKLIVIWGKNPAECNIQQMVPIEKAQRKGARVIVIDPRRTPSSERADKLLQPIPGTDGILALAIAKIIVDKQYHDKAFIEKHVLGFSEFAQSLKSLDLSYASRECGIPLYLIEELAEDMGTTKPMTLMAGYGVQRYTNGGQTTRCLLALSILTGNIGKPGACWHYANLQSYIFDAIKEPESYFPDSEKDKPFRRSISTALLGKQMLQTHSPELKMAWVERGNPLTQNPDTNLTQAAFRKLEFKVVVEQFMTDTALEADLILPAKSMFEQSDIIGSYWNPYVQLKQKVVDPPGEVKPETEIYFLLAQKLGFSRAEISKNIPPPTDEGINQWLANYLDAVPGLSLEKLKMGPALAPGIEEIPFSDMKFLTPSGKIELLSEKASILWGVPILPSYERLEEGQKGKNSKFPLSLISPNSKNRIHSQFGNLEVIKALEPLPVMVMSPTDALKRGISNGEKVRVFNERGELFIKAKYDFSLRPGNVVITNGYWNSEGANPNMLSKGRETDMGYGSAFHDNMVELEKVE